MDPDKHRNLYANLLDEVKVRIECIDSAARGFMKYPTPIVREFCWFQLRMLCELVALSCIVAHGDITFLKSHKVGRSHSADDILEKMTGLREHFFPVAVRQAITMIDGKRGFEMTPIEPAPLSKEDLLKLYGRTHRFVHRGSLKRLLSSDTPIDMTVDMPEIVGWAQKINDLLSTHAIFIDSHKVWLGMLRNLDDNNRVQVAVAEAPRGMTSPD